MTRLTPLCAVAAALLMSLSACGSDSSDSDAPASFTVFPNSATQGAQPSPSLERSVETPPEAEPPAPSADAMDPPAVEGLLAPAQTVCGEVQGTDGGSMQVVAWHDNTSCDVGVETMAYYIMAIREDRVKSNSMSWQSKDGWYCFRAEDDLICSSTGITEEPASRGSGVVTATPTAE